MSKKRFKHADIRRHAAELPDKYTRLMFRQLLAECEEHKKARLWLEHQLQKQSDATQECEQAIELCKAKQRSFKKLLMQRTVELAEVTRALTVMQRTKFTPSE